MSDFIKALTICQPYAHLIINPREKRVENREWFTHYRGPLLIHAGKSRDWLNGLEPADYTFGALLGLVDVIDCLHIDEIERGTHDAKYPWLARHPHASGTYCLILGEDVIRFERPIPYRGAQRFFNVPHQLLPR